MLALAAALVAALSGSLVAVSAATPAFAASGVSQTGDFPVGNMLDYDNSDFEGVANFTSVSNIGTISDSSAASLHGNDSLMFTSSAKGTTVLKLQVGSTPTQIDVAGSDTYVVGGWFKLPAANSGESVTFGLGLYDSSGSWIGWSDTSALSLNAVDTWQYVQGQITVPSNASFALDSPEISLSNAVAGQTTYADMLVLEPRRAAQAIGAHGNCTTDPCTYTDQTWMNSDSTTSGIGPLQADKQFFGSSDLPSTFIGTNCNKIENDLTADGDPPTAWPVCIMAYNGYTMTQQDMDNFLQHVPRQQEIYIVWHSEAEGSSSGYSGMDGCTQYTGAAGFTCEFQRQAYFVQHSQYWHPNIFMAMDSSGYQYNPDGKGIGCHYIPPSNASTSGGADIYLVDMYQNGIVDGTNINQSADATNWQNWLSCVTAMNRPIGFGEYGLDQSDSSQGTEPGCDQTPTNNTNAQCTPGALEADNTYLRQLPMSSQSQMHNHVPVAMWAYWYSDYGGTPDNTVFDNTYGAITTWQNIETANGGG
jgi:hypothetical protein